MATKLITRTVIKWKDTLLGIELGEELKVKAPEYGGIPSSLSSIASRLKSDGIASFVLRVENSEIIIKRIS
ncbi:MAG: hypothetical protein EGP82_10180 [Odoribacter splanchnicus]|nr:hypothetical protein [Odoribacter splanchnicus]